jgi:WD40 repeat protein
MVAFSRYGITGAVVWDLATKQLMAEVTSFKPGSNRNFTAGTLSPDGALLAMGDRKGIVSLWDAASGKFLRDLGQFEGSVESVAFSSDGRRIAAARTDSRNGLPLLPFRVPARNERLLVMEVATGQVDFSPAPGIGVRAEFSPDGKYLLAFKKNPARLLPNSPEYLMALWDTATWKEVRTLGEAQSWSFTADGQRLALGGRISGDNHPFLKIVDVGTGEVMVSLNPTRAVGDIALDAQGKLLAVAVVLTPLVDIWDVTGKKVVRTLRGHTGWLNGIALTPDGKTLATCSWDRTIKFWDPRADAEVIRLPGPDATRATAAAFRPDGLQLAFVEESTMVLFRPVKAVTLWDPAAGKAAQVLGGHTDSARRVAYSADGKVLASGSRDQTVWTWDVQTGRPLAIFRDHKGSIEGLAVSPDGRWVASSHEPPELRNLRFGQARSYKPAPGEIKVWDARTGAQRQNLLGHSAPVSHIAFSPDGRWIASADHAGMVKLWEAQTGAPKGEMKAKGAEGLRFSPDSRLLAIIGGDAIILRDVAAGTELARFGGHGEGTFGGLAFRPDGKRAASAWGREVKLWEIPSGLEILTLPVLDPGHQIQGIAALTFTPDGGRLLAAGRDGSVLAWDSAQVR